MKRLLVVLGCAIFALSLVAIKPASAVIDLAASGIFGNASQRAFSTALEQIATQPGNPAGVAAAASAIMAAGMEPFYQEFITPYIQGGSTNWTGLYQSLDQSAAKVGSIVAALQSKVGAGINAADLKTVVESVLAKAVASIRSIADSVKDGESKTGYFTRLRAQIVTALNAHKKDADAEGDERFEATTKGIFSDITAQTEFSNIDKTVLAECVYIVEANDQLVTDGTTGKLADGTIGQLDLFRQALE